MFSVDSFSSISLATVTPSLVIVGEPNFLSSTALRPLGPRVTLTALASLFTPDRNRVPGVLSVNDVLGHDSLFLLDKRFWGDAPDG